jgi:hypothetical protein
MKEVKFSWITFLRRASTAALITGGSVRIAFLMLGLPIDMATMGMFSAAAFISGAVIDLEVFSKLKKLEKDINTPEGE